jgi:GDP-4-dehydro-6-deoxy-D-mannose reductase
MVRAYGLAARRGEPGAVYNIGSGRPIRIQRLLDILITCSARDITVEADPARMRPVDVPCVSADSRLFRTLTGWEPALPLEQTLHDTLEYWRAWVRENQ